MKAIFANVWTWMLARRSWLVTGTLALMLAALNYFYGSGALILGVCAIIASMWLDRNVLQHVVYEAEDAGQRKTC